ncbi:hypothetical protein DMENIID0001_018720 [Sergentomyia squamirostris]
MCDAPSSEVRQNDMKLQSQAQSSARWKVNRRENDDKATVVKSVDVFSLIQYRRDYSTDPIIIFNHVTLIRDTIG